MIPGIVAGYPVSGGGGGPAQDFTFDPADTNALVTLSNGNKTASVTSSLVNSCAMCTKPKASGKVIFEFVVDAMPAATGRVAIGMADVPASGATQTSAWVNTGFNWFVRKSSALSNFYYSGSTFDALNTTTQSFNTGDRITFTVDFSTKEVKAYRNGALIHARTVSSIDTGTYSYVPVVKQGGGDVLCRVSIPSDILYPVVGFTPWA